MQCPIDGATLVISDRSGIEIDYCPDCRGVWLDRGELDKLIERSYSEPAPGQSDSWQQRQGQQQWAGGSPQGGQGHGSQGGQSGTAATVGKIADQVLRQVQKRSGGNQGNGQQQGRRSWLGDILR